MEISALIKCRLCVNADSSPRLMVDMSPQIRKGSGKFYKKINNNLQLNSGPPALQVDLWVEIAQIASQVASRPFSYFRPHAVS